MRTPICLLLLAAAAAPAAPAQVIRPLYDPGSRTINLSAISRTVSDTMGLAFSIEAPTAEDREVRIAQAGRAFAALAQVYDQLKVPPDLRDSARMIVGNQQFRLRSDLGGKSLPLYLECGQDVYGLYADIAPVQMSLLTFLTPLGGSTIEVRTVLIARAVDIPRIRPNTRDCRSTGELEKRIHQMLVKALAKEGYRGTQ
ncbi:MAG: hypothetical protein ACT4PM_11050 [Gemmatimonadales bacterium]